MQQQEVLSMEEEALHGRGTQTHASDAIIMHQLPNYAHCIILLYRTALYCYGQLPAWKHTHRVKGRQKIGKWYMCSVH